MSTVAGVAFVMLVFALKQCPKSTWKFSEIFPPLGDLPSSASVSFRSVNSFVTRARPSVGGFGLAAIEQAAEFSCLLPEPGSRRYTQAVQHLRRRRIRNWHVAAIALLSSRLPPGGAVRVRFGARFTAREVAERLIKSIAVIEQLVKDLQELLLLIRTFALEFLILTHSFRCRTPPALAPGLESLIILTLGPVAAGAPAGLVAARRGAFAAFAARRFVDCRRSR